MIDSSGRPVARRGQIAAIGARLRLGGLAVFAATLAACSLPSPGAAEPIVGPIPQTVADEYVENPWDIQATTWVEGLEVPWSLIFLPDGHALVSERPGRIRLIRDGALQSAPYFTMEDLPQRESGVVSFVVSLFSSGEGGLMGLARHPDFPTEPYVYAMHSYREDGEVLNRVVRLVDEGNSARLEKVIIDGIPGASYHDGGRIAFGPDGMLYVATGDATEPPLAQDRASPSGKILRLTPDGSIPPDNPFPNSPVWSYGHRNPQGLVWHPETGALFESEHGPSGDLGLRAHDEINVIRQGGNYGWPEAVGAPGLEPYIDPIAAWKNASVPPGGMAFWRGDLYVATMRSEALLRLAVEKDADGWRVRRIERLFARDDSEGRFGRLRDAVVGPDGALYVLTSNRDGRGEPREGDDRILRLTPAGE